MIFQKIYLLFYFIGWLIIYLAYLQNKKKQRQELNNKRLLFDNLAQKFKFQKIGDFIYYKNNAILKEDYLIIANVKIKHYSKEYYLTLLMRNCK